MSLFWEVYQQGQISQAADAAREGAQRADQVQQGVRSLEQRLDKMVMINMALWTLLKEVSDLTDEDLLKRVEEIDLSDGQLDGKVRASAQKCSQCNRTVSKRHGRCLYCGAEIEDDQGPFGTVL